MTHNNIFSNLIVGKYYLCDAGYATKPGFIPPFKEVRYHLKDFPGPHQHRDYKELYNHRPSLLRMSVERAFGILNGSFKILHQDPSSLTPFRLIQSLHVVFYFIMRHGG